ncbi:MULTISPECIES: condensation domain-containing protein [Bradyrhizobium]|uniref:condensation domain-containing protein n=1 Tax=Bradyrhizobium elkanii TaxID=29448 RepID=UPI0024BF1692|nr:condensation domain-containing protein [Bradyrhizobium elkanii]
MLASGNRAGALPHTEPTSASQRRTWFMELVAPGIPQHHLPFALEIFGDLDIAALQLSLDFVVERHEALRTVFVDDRGELRQAVGGPRAVVALIDAPSRPDTELNTILREQVTAPFDLNRGPLVRLVAVRRAPGAHVLVFVLHHIIADNLSLGVFAREMAEVYRAFSARSVPVLAPLPWQYVDFAIAEARWLASPTFRTRLKCYAEKIGPTTARLDFGSEQISTTGQAGANHVMSLDPAVVDRLKQVAQRGRVTLFTVLLAALETVLAPYADRPDFVIAVPVAGRASDGAEGVIGPLANIVGLKTSLRAGGTMAELLADTGRQLMDTLEYENVPWDALVRANNPSRSADSSPLSQVMLSWAAVPAPFQRFGSLPCRQIWLPSPVPSIDLFVTASETPDGILWLGFDSRPDKVSPRTVFRLSGTLQTVLLEIAYGDITTLRAYPRHGTGAAMPRHHIRDAFGATSANSFAPSPCETTKRREVLEKLVAELWRRLLGVPPNHMREDFFDAGGDSLLAVRLMSQLCIYLDRKLPVALFFKAPTVAGLVNGLLENNTSELDYSIIKLADGIDGRVLFVSAAQNGLDELAAAMPRGPSIYRLDAYFLQEQQLLAGRPMLDSVEAIAAEFRYRLKAVQPKGPYLLAGGCEGGVLSYELALQLQRQGDEVAFLAMLDTPVRGFWESKPAFLGSVRVAKRRFLDFILRQPPQPTTPEHEQVQRIWAMIWQAVRSYQPERLFDGDVHQFKAEMTRLGIADVASGWDRRVTGRVAVHMLPGDHLSWITNPQSRATISAVLDAVVRPPVSPGPTQ